MPLRRAILVSIGVRTLLPEMAFGQSTRSRQVGLLIPRPANDSEGQASLAAFQDALERQGWQLGQTVNVTVRWLSDPGRVRASVEEIVALSPDVIVLSSTPYLRAAKQLSKNIPIVFTAVADPLKQGFVDNLATPGGFVTGFGIEETSMGGKWVELLKEIDPALTRVLVLFNPASVANLDSFLTTIDAAAHSLGVKPVASPVHDDDEIQQVVSAAAVEPGAGLIVIPDFWLYERRDTIIGLASRHKLPGVYYHKGFAQAGGLLAFGVDRVELYRRAANYVDQILRGARPGDLPVQMPTRFEFIVNLKTAKALGLTVPQSLLASANEVIE
jgi:putative ABC transport system substrate-binding protein